MSNRNAIPLGSIEIIQVVRGDDRFVLSWRIGEQLASHSSHISWSVDHRKLNPLPFPDIQTISQKGLKHAASVDGFKGGNHSCIVDNEDQRVDDKVRTNLFAKTCRSEHTTARYESTPHRRLRRPLYCSPLTSSLPPGKTE
jgi:hypothetical protein